MDFTPKEAAALANYMQYALDHPDHGACNDPEECARLNHHMDWSAVNSLANRSANYFDGDLEQATKFAIHVQQQRRKMATSTVYLGPSSARTQEIAVITGASGSPAIVASLPTTIGHTVYVHNTTAIWNPAWAASQTVIPHPPACHKPHRNKTECRYQKCMMKHYSPLVVTTYFQAAAVTPGCSPDAANPWQMRTSHLASAHWGVTKQGLYYPWAPTVTSKHQKTYVTMTTTKPEKTAPHGIKAPTCWDEETCCYECRHKHSRGL